MRVEGLHEELQDYLRPSPFGEGTLMIHHPLCINIGPVEHLPLNWLNMTINDVFVAKTVALREAFETKDWSSYVFLHERPYRLDALREAMDAGVTDDPATFWSLVSSVWTDSENIAEMVDDWYEIWGSHTPDREKVMDDEEAAALAAMPEKFTVWRGVGHEDAVYGFSWTTNKAKAEWFARRFTSDDREPHVASAQVFKRDVLAYFTGRNESEIVVLPDDLCMIEVCNLGK